MLLSCWLWGEHPSEPSARRTLPALRGALPALVAATPLVPQCHFAQDELLARGAHLRSPGTPFSPRPLESAITWEDWWGNWWGAIATWLASKCRKFFQVPSLRTRNWGASSHIPHHAAVLCLGSGACEGTQSS